MKTLLLLFSTLFCFAGYSQSIENKIFFLDENNKEISQSVYIQKCKTYVLKCQKYQTRDVLIHKINYRYQFNKLSTTEYNQIRQLLTLDSKKTINKNEVLVIKYQDTLIDYDKALENRKRHFRDYHNNNIKDSDYSKKDFSRSRKRYVKNKFKCVEKFEKKYETKIIHVYKHGENAKESYGKLNMVKDRGVIKNLFFKNMYESYMLVLRPSGDYLLIGGHLSDKDLGKLIKENDWSKYKEQLNLSKNKKKALGAGIFEKITGYHKKHCF